MPSPVPEETCRRPSVLQGKKYLLLFLLLIFSFAFPACGYKSLLLRDSKTPVPEVQQAFAKAGKSDYLLMGDEGYSFRLIYLCENRAYNFVEEPVNNPIMVSLQPILDTSVEKRLPPDDLRRIWACMERKVWEEHSRVEGLKLRMTEEKLRMQNELQSALKERDGIIGEIARQKELSTLRQRHMEEEIRKAEEDRLRRADEELRRRTEEDRKIRIYRAGEREKEEASPPPPPVRITETGTFLVMKDCSLLEEPRENSRSHGRARKYDLFEVINSKTDDQGTLWHQVILSDRVVSLRGKRYGWTPEDRSFWSKNKLLAWVYPGDPGRIPNSKPVRMNVEEIQFTGRKTSTSQRATLFEVVYEINAEFRETIYGWVEDKQGVRRKDKNNEEMRNLVQRLFKLSWPVGIQNDILRGQIRQGFSPDQVVLSWGRPDHVNTTRTLVGVHEQWVYGENPFPNSYVYFENGQVKSWEFLKKGGK